MQMDVAIEENMGLCLLDLVKNAHPKSQLVCILVLIYRSASFFGVSLIYHPQGENQALDQAMSQ